MADKTKKTEKIKISSEDVGSLAEHLSPISRPKTKPVEKKPAVKKKPVQVMTFARYFNLLGRPAHHKAGMLAFKPTKGKKTKGAWDALFKSY